jgi:hypothetical protein
MEASEIESTYWAISVISRFSKSEIAWPEVYTFRLGFSGKIKAGNRWWSCKLSKYPTPEGPGLITPGRG